MAELTDDQKYISLLVQSLGKMDERFEQLQQWQEQQVEIIENQNSKIDKLETIVVKQDRLIELLSSRSIKQEQDVENIRWKQLEVKSNLESTVDALSARYIELEADIKELKKDKEAS